MCDFRTRFCAVLGMWHLLLGHGGAAPPDMLFIVATSRTIKLMPCLKVGRNWWKEMLYCPFQCLLLAPGSPQSFSLSPRGIIFRMGFPWYALLCMNGSFLGCGYYYTKTMGLLGTWTPQSLTRTRVGFVSTGSSVQCDVCCFEKV